MIYAIAALLITAADYFSKLFILKNIRLGETFFSLAPIADFTYVQNKGAAFSMMSGRLSLLSFISVAFCAAVIVYWIKKKPTQPLFCTALTMMFAGALGNAIDRIFYGFVVDFISLDFISFPVFNIADIAITVGAVLLVIYFIFFDKEEKSDAEN